mmetsp:Transcript_130267/g.291364  ORF Transcript_130267/g.291364 Transcript_130267/m.291364 type:complete len:201 (-) Transcript_130267:561-1163(-)
MRSRSGPPTASWPCACTLTSRRREAIARFSSKPLRGSRAPKKLWKPWLPKTPNPAGRSIASFPVRSTRVLALQRSWAWMRLLRLTRRRSARMPIRLGGIWSNASRRCSRRPPTMNELWRSAVKQSRHYDALAHQRLCLARKPCFAMACLPPGPWALGTFGGHVPLSPCSQRRPLYRSPAKAGTAWLSCVVLPPRSQTSNF